MSSTIIVQNDLTQPNMPYINPAHKPGHPNRHIIVTGATERTSYSDPIPTQQQSLPDTDLCFSKAALKTCTLTNDDNIDNKDAWTSISTTVTTSLPVVAPKPSSPYGNMACDWRMSEHSPLAFTPNNGYASDSPSSSSVSPTPSIHRFFLTGDNESMRAGPSDLNLTLDAHPFHKSARDVRHPETLHELKIVSVRGTVRGVKNRVRAGIQAFVEQDETNKNWKNIEEGRIIFYTTSMRIVRDTYERCVHTRQILQTHMVEYEERDVFMSRENQLELKQRIKCEEVDVPQVFADGVHLGGASEIDEMNENSELRRIFQHFNKIAAHVMSSCDGCGGYRYIPCASCHGSKKSLNRNHFTEEFLTLRCIICDENGLVRCESCNPVTTETT